MVAIGGANGEVKVGNVLRTFRRAKRNHLVIFQQVLNRSNGELKIKHHLLPEVANTA